MSEVNLWSVFILDTRFPWNEIGSCEQGELSSQRSVERVSFPSYHFRCVIDPVKVAAVTISSVPQNMFLYSSGSLPYI